MEIGSKEWLAKVEENITFPAIVAFHLIKETDDSIQFIHTVVKTKAQLKNVKYADAEAYTWTSKGSALLDVAELRSAKDYEAAVRKIHSLWGFVLKTQKADTP